MTVDNISMHCSSCLPTISFSLFSHFCTAKRSRSFLNDLLRLRGFPPDPQLRPLGRPASCGHGWFLSHHAIRLQLLATRQDHGGTATSHGNTAASRAVAARGAARQPGPRCPGSGGPGGSLLPSASWAQWPARVRHPSPLTQGGWHVCAGTRRHHPGTACLLNEGRSPRCSVWEPAVTPRWHGRHTLPAGCCTPRLRLHQMAALMLQLLIATTSSVITTRCRQCGHPLLLLSVSSEESSFALLELCFVFTDLPQNLPMNAAISLCVCGILWHEELQLVTSSGQAQCNPLPFHYTWHSRKQTLIVKAHSF